MRRQHPFWAFLAAAAVCATLVPITAAVGAWVGDANGMIRAMVACAIAAPSGLVVYTSAAATGAVDRTR